MAVLVLVAVPVLVGVAVRVLVPVLVGVIVRVAVGVKVGETPVLEHHVVDVEAALLGSVGINLNLQRDILTRICTLRSTVRLTQPPVLLPMQRVKAVTCTPFTSTRP